MWVGSLPAPIYLEKLFTVTTRKTCPDWEGWIKEKTSRKENNYRKK